MSGDDWREEIRALAELGERVEELERRCSVLEDTLEVLDYDDDYEDVEVWDEDDDEDKDEVVLLGDIDDDEEEDQAIADAIERARMSDEPVYSQEEVENELGGVK